ncbi:UNVERIFIED_CONTAM: L-rhamnose mutarotase [Microbacterium sp. SLM126]
MELMIHRTTLRDGAIDAYREIHSRVPDAVADALRGAGVRKWSIWRDGTQLIHVIETHHGLDEMERRVAALGPIDPTWDALIAPLGQPGEASSSRLEPIWLLTRDLQASGSEVPLLAADPTSGGAA